LTRDPVEWMPCEARPRPLRTGGPAAGLAVDRNQRATVLAALQLFDCLLVNPVRDGMNLVAKARSRAATTT
jgi:hypothetical protein